MCKLAAFPLIIPILWEIWFTSGETTGQDGALAYNCSRQLLTRCLSHLQSITSDQSLAFAANDDELEILCKATEMSVVCIQEYSRHCFNLQQQELYRKLIGGAVEVMGDLCQDGPFRDNFLRHAACSRLTATDYHKCGQHYRKLLNETETRRSVSSSPRDTLKNACCAYSEFVACSTRAMADECGAEAAEFVTQYTRRAGGPLIHTHCAPFLRDSAECSSGSTLFAAISSVWPKMMVIFAICSAMLRVSL